MGPSPLPQVVLLLPVELTLQLQIPVTKEKYKGQTETWSLKHSYSQVAVAFFLFCLMYIMTIFFIIKTNPQTHIMYLLPILTMVYMHFPPERRPLCIIMN